ncbi:unnamed protein product [Mortierella alpina]
MILRPPRRQSVLKWHTALVLAIVLLPTTAQPAPHSNHATLYRRQKAEMPHEAAIVLNATSDALSTLESLADAFVWEGQHDVMRIQLDARTFERTSSMTRDPTASAGSITYHALLDNADALPSWMTFDSIRLLISGAPPLGTYNRSTTLIVRVEASSVSGSVEATHELTIRVLKHSLALSTSPQRACSSSTLYASSSDPSQHSSWQEYLPDINLDPEQRTVNLTLSMDLFRIDGCTQPAGLGLPRASDDSAIVSTLVNSTGTTVGVPNGQTRDLPTLASLTVALSAETMQALGRADSRLPGWLVFDEEQGTLKGVVPLDVPARMVLEFDTTDSFGSMATIKLQIFSHPAVVPLFAFQHPAPDVWIKSNEPFDIRPLAAFNTDPAWLPLESRFFFQPAHPINVAPMLLQLQTSGVPKDIQDHTARSSFAGTLGNNSNSSSPSVCTYRGLWGIEENNNQQAPFLSWFNQTSFVTHQPPPNNTTMALQGFIPCDVVVQVRWIARNAIGQWASTEFMIWASQSGPPVASGSPHPTGAESTTRKPSTGSLAIKILVALAVAVPSGLALWFIVSRYFWSCSGDRQQDDNKLGTQDDLEQGQRSRVSSGVEYEDRAWEPRRDHRGPPTTDMAVSRELGYRSSHEDDPSVGHHDSYSDKYVAEYGPPRAHSNASEGESSGSGKRLSVLGWFFRQKQASVPGSDREGSTASTMDLRRAQGSDGASLFNLKRVSVGSPFESKRFGFVNGSRMSAYDSGSDRASAVGASDEPKHTQSPCGQRSCRSAASTVTGYMAGMSDDSSSIESRQQVNRQHRNGTGDMSSLEGDMTENEGSQKDPSTTRSGSKTACKQAEPNARLSWAPSLFLLDPGLFDTDDSEPDSPKQTDEEQDECRVKKLQTPERAFIVSRSDSGALMSTPSSAVSLHHLQDALVRQPLSISTSCMVSSPTSSIKSDLSPKSPYSDRLLSTSTASLSLSVTTVPTTENVFAKERQLSMHASPGSLQRRSIVELLQSNDTPVSPLSAFSASLPSWGHVADEANGHGKEYSSEQPRGQKDRLVVESEHGSIFEQEQGQQQDQDLNGLAVHSKVAGTSQETAKWMMVPSTQAIRSVSIRKAGSNSNEDSEWISQLLAEGMSDDDDDDDGDRDDDERSDIVGEGCFRSSIMDEKCKDQRHVSLKSELGIIEQAAAEQASSTDDRDYEHTPAPQSGTVKVALVASQLPPDQGISLIDVGLTEAEDIVIAPLSMTAAGGPHSQDHESSSTSRSSSGRSSPNPTHSVVFTRPSDIRARPTSFPGRTLTPAPDAGVPHRFVKATVGTAFHYAALSRCPSAAGPTSSALQSPSQRHSLPALPSVSGSQSSTCIKNDARHQAEYRAYLVSDPQNSCLTPLAEAAPNTIVASEVMSPADAHQERRKLPHWIQFNSRMRSLWGRPVPGTAGEWQISLVQSIPRPPSIPLPPLPPLSHSPPPQPTSQAELTSEQQIELVRLLVRDTSDVSP